jgi:hypothetical protein
LKKLTELYLFDLSDKKNHLKENMLRVVLNVDKVPMEKLDDYFKLFQRRLNYQMKNKVISEVTNGNVVPVFNPDGIRIPTFLPCYLMNTAVKPIAIVNLSNDATMTKNGELEIDNRTLFALLQSGTILRECLLNWNKISISNSVIAQEGCVAFSKLFTKILDKMYAINLDGMRSDIVRFITAKFFLLFHLQKSEGEVVNSTAYRAVINNTTRTTIFNCDSSFSEDAYSSIAKLIENMASLPGLNGLTFRKFIQEWMNMYNSSTILALEYFPLFCHMVFSAMIGAHINKEFIIESVASREVNELYNELSKILR